MTNRSRPTRSGPALRTLLAILFMAYLGMALHLSAQTIVGSGLNAQEGAAIGAISVLSPPPAQYTDTMWADSSYLRWMMSNHGSSAVNPVMSWPCQTSGCIVYSSGTQVPATTGFYAETALPIGSAGTPLIVSPTTNLPIWGSVNLSSITGLSNTITTGTGHATTLATSTGSLTTANGNFAKIANSNGDYGDSGIATTSVAAADGTAGDGGVWNNGTPAGFGYAGVTVSPAQSIMYVHQLNLKWPQVIGHATTQVGTGIGGEVLYVCLYDATGATLLWSAHGFVNTSGATVSFSSSPYTAPPGIYQVAFEETTGPSAATLLGYGTTSGVFSVRNRNPTTFVRDATSTSVVASSTCPTTMAFSSLTAVTTVTGPASDVMILLEP